MSIYNFATVAANYLYRSPREQSIRSLNIIPTGYLNPEELEMYVEILDHEASYGTPSIEDMLHKRQGYYENMLAIVEVNGEYRPKNGLESNYDYILAEFDLYARSRYMEQILNSASSMNLTNPDDIKREINEIPQISFAESKEIFKSYEEEIEALEREDSGSTYLGLNPYQDAQLGKISRGKIGLIASNAGVGKTYALVMAAFRAAYLEGKKVVLSTYEMNADDIGKRIKAIMGQFNGRLYTIKTENNQEILKANLKIVSEVLAPYYTKNGQIFIFEDASVSEIKAFLDEEYERTGVPVDLVCIDGAYLIPPPPHMADAQPWMKTVSNLNLLKKVKLGKWEGDRFGIKYPILLTGQMGKDKNGDSLGDLGDSIRLAQDADFVVNIKQVVANVRTSRIIKNRNGDSPNIDYYFAIDYDSSTLIAPDSSFDGTVESWVTRDSDGWVQLFDIIDKRELDLYFPNEVDPFTLQMACRPVDLNAPVQYTSKPKGKKYPYGVKEIYDKWSKTDQNRWDRFSAKISSELLLNMFAESIEEGLKNESG